MTVSLDDQESGGGRSTSPDGGLWRVLIGRGASMPTCVMAASSPYLTCQVLTEGDPDVGTDDWVALEVLIPGSSPTFWDWASPVCSPDRKTIAVVIADPIGIPEHIAAVAALPASDVEQLMTISAILDLYNPNRLMSYPMADVIDCFRRGSSVEFFNVPASNETEALAGLQDLLPRFKRELKSGVIFTVRNLHSMHFDVMFAFGDALESQANVEIHDNIAYEWREELGEGVSVLLIGTKPHDGHGLGLHTSTI